MRFLKYPTSALLTDISPVENRVFLQLLFNHFRRCGSDYDREFYISDRDLADVSGCCHKSVWKAKNSLRNNKLIDFYTGFKNITHYKILSPNGNNKKT